MRYVWLVLLLVGCGAQPVVEGSGRVACQAFRPITYSASQDTPETVRQVREHNAAFQAVCGSEK